jgi:hypothetical protein
MKKTFHILISVVLPAALLTGAALVGGADAYASESTSEVLSAEDDDVPDRSFEKIEFEQVDRVESLKKFFKRYNSPLEAHAETFVKVADKYGIDYRILPAISCVESTCARFYIRETHNPFGWGSGRIAFGSFDEAIEGVGKGLYDGYVSKGLTTVEKIGPVYCPPSYKSWVSKVNYFMDQVEKT